MKLKYANRLTDNELKNILISLAKDYYGMNNLDGDCCIVRNDSSIVIGGYFNPIIVDGVKRSAPVKIELDDFRVWVEDGSYEYTDMTIDYRRYMFDKYHKKYAVDCFLYECEED